MIELEIEDALLLLETRNRDLLLSFTHLERGELVPFIEPVIRKYPDLTEHVIKRFTDYSCPIDEAIANYETLEPHAHLFGANDLTSIRSEQILLNLLNNPLHYNR